MARYLVCYDISHNGRRTKAARLLEKAGPRLQESVFLADLTPAARERLVQRLTELLRDEDKLLVLLLCRSCLQQSRHYGRSPSPCVVV